MEMTYFKLDRFHKHGTGIRHTAYTECESLHVANYSGAGRRTAVTHLWNLSLGGTGDFDAELHVSRAQIP